MKPKIFKKNRARSDSGLFFFSMDRIGYLCLLYGEKVDQIFVLLSALRHAPPAPSG